MNDKLLNILNVVFDALDVYLCSMTKAKFKQSVLHSFKRLAVWGFCLIVLLLSTWLAFLGTLFFYLDSICFTHLQAMLTILEINLVGLLILDLYFRNLKKHMISIRRSGLGVVVAYIIRSLHNIIRNK